MLRRIEAGKPASRISPARGVQFFEIQMTSTKGFRAAGTSAALVLVCAAAHAEVAYTLIKLESFGGSRSGAHAVNGAGVVVGFATTAPNDDDPPSEFLRAARWTGSSPADLGTLGGPYATANGISDANVIVGYSLVPGSYNARAALWRDGVATDLGGLGGSRSEAKAINQKGTAVGYAVTLGEKKTRATVWKNGVIKALPGIGGNTAAAEAISNTGFIAGWSTVSKRRAHAVVWKGSVVTDLGTSHDGTSNAYGVNDAGQVVGSRVVQDSHSRPTLWVGTTMTDLGTLGGDQGWAWAINNKGDVVGASSKSGMDEARATLWSGGRAVDLNDVIDPEVRAEGWLLLEARAINQNGYIAGIMRNEMGWEERGYLLKPVTSAARH